jgi:hypothetical protein
MSTQQEHRHFDPFRVLSRSERERHLNAYLDYLREHDGALLFETQTLPCREAYFRDLADKPVAWGGEVDYEGFTDHLHGSGTRATDERILWLATAAKANLIESYGVRVELANLLRRRDRVAASDILYLYQMLEEKYHTRILSELCRSYGLDHPVPDPPWPKRLAVHLMIYLPESIRWISVLTGEALGSSLFRILLETTQHFSEDPEVEERMRSLVTEIWTDEVLHAAYLRAKIGRVGLWIARTLVPLVGWVMMKDLPPFEGGGTHRRVLDRLRRGIEIPPGIDWIAD